MPGNIKYSKICLILLGIICAGTLFACMEGIKWPKLHPDEQVIGTWVERSADSVYIKDRVYPNGFFALARPFVLISRALIRLNERLAYHCGEIDRIRNVKPDGIYFGRWFNAWAGTLLCVVMFLLVSRMARSQWAGLFAAALAGFAQYTVEHSHYAETDMAAVLTLTFALWLWVKAGDTVRLRWFVAAALASGFAAGTKFTILALAPIVVIQAIMFASDGGTVKHGNCKETRQQSAAATDWECSRLTPLRRYRLLRPNLWLSAIKFTCLGILLFGAGFAIANPAILLDFKWFWAGLAAEKQRVFAETALNLGPLAARPDVKYLHHFWNLHFSMQTLGYPWLVLIAAGLPCVALSMARRYWSILLLFPIIYAGYWIFMAPWVRSQEFLLFLPSLAALAALSLTILWRAKNYFIRAFTLVIAVLAIVVNGYNGLRVSALFGWQDTRFLAWEWLQTRLPLESKTAVERYAEAACVTSWKPPLAITKIEHCGMAPVVEQGADYLLRTSNISGRGLRNPLTGELYPEPAAHFRQFLMESELLCAWAPLPPHGFATFMSPTIELYGLKKFAPTVALQIALPQPALIVNQNQNPAGRQTFFPIGRGLGCANCLLIDRLPQTIAIGGPDALDKPVFLVLNTAERPAVINVRGFGLDKKIALEPYDTRLIPLKRPEWRPRIKSFETITLNADPVEDVLYIPCFARIVFTADEAARIFMDTMRDDRLRECLDLLENDLSPDAKYTAATRLGLWPMADQAEQSVSAIQTGIGKCIQTDPESVSINGVSGYYYGQFARARLQQPYDFACLFPLDKYGRESYQDAMEVLALQSSQDGGDSEKAVRMSQITSFADLPLRPSVARPTGLAASAGADFAKGRGENAVAERGTGREVGYYHQSLAIPVLIGRGRYELRGELMLKLEGAETDSCVPLVIRTMPGEADADYCLELQPGTWRRFSLVFQPGREIQSQIDFQSPSAAQVYLKNMEICWNLTNALETVRGELALAAIGHSIHRAEWEKAAAQITALTNENPAADELACPALAREIRQMMFACAGNLKDDSGLRLAARRLLELAPRHYASLLALAAEDETARGLAHQMEGNLKSPLVFAPWLALVGFSFNAETREVRCVFEALRNETPGLAAVFWLQRRDEWRRKQVQSLTAGLSGIALATTERRLNRGERVVITVRLNAAFGQTLDLNKLALGIETDVLWHAGAVSLEDGGYVLPFSRLKELSGPVPDNNILPLKNLP